MRARAQTHARIRHESIENDYTTSNQRKNNAQMQHTHCGSNGKTKEKNKMAFMKTTIRIHTENCNHHNDQRGGSP